MARRQDSAGARPRTRARATTEERHERIRASIILRAQGLRFADIGRITGVSADTASRDVRAGQRQVSPGFLDEQLSAVVAEYWAVIEDSRKPTENSPAGDLRARTYALNGLRSLLGLDRLTGERAADTGWRDEAREVLGLK